MYSDGDASRTLIVAERPFDAEGWSAELVLLSRDASGALTLVSRTQGRVVELVVGEDVAEYCRLWTVAAADVPVLVETWLRGACPDDETFVRWLDTHGIEHTAGDWHRYRVRPVDEGRIALAVGRSIIGDLADNDEGTTMADRFLAWLTERQIPHRMEEVLAR